MLLLCSQLPVYTVSVWIEPNNIWAALPEEDSMCSVYVPISVLEHRHCTVPTMSLGSGITINHSVFSVPATNLGTLYFGPAGHEWLISWLCDWLTDGQGFIFSVYVAVAEHVAVWSATQRESLRATETKRRRLQIFICEPQIYAREQKGRLQQGSVSDGSEIRAIGLIWKVATEVFRAFTKKEINKIF